MTFVTRRLPLRLRWTPVTEQLDGKTKRESSRSEYPRQTRRTRPYESRYRVRHLCQARSHAVPNVRVMTGDTTAPPAVIATVIGFPPCTTDLYNTNSLTVTVILFKYHGERERQSLSQARSATSPHQRRRRIWHAYPVDADTHNG